MSDDVDAGQAENSRRARRLARFYAHRATRVLVVVVTVVALPWSTYDVWRFFANRQVIDSACAGLVPAGKVADLPYSGGRISHHHGSIDLDKVSGACWLYSTAAGEARDADSERPFFRAGVGTEPGEPDSPIGRTDQLVGVLSPHLDGPLGGGIAGQVSDSGVSVHLPCDLPSRGVHSIAAGAVSIPGSVGPRGAGGQIDQETRKTLASLAVTMTNRLAGKLGCQKRLPAPPDQIPAVNGDFVPASDADGTCAWYRKALDAGVDDSFAGLPDQVVETPVGGDVWTETCGLAMSGEAAQALWDRAFADESDATYIGPPDADPGDWWAATQSFFGGTAQNVAIDGLSSDQPLHLEPGAAGHSSQESVWWASSHCPDGPALHTLTVGFPYEEVAASHFRPVFRAYVEDVAKRCGLRASPSPAETRSRGRRLSD